MSLSEDLDLLGAEGLSGQYITLRVRSIDKQKLGAALGGGPAAALLPAALALVDVAPQQTLGMLMPLVKEKVGSKYGVDLDVQITDAPPAAGQKPKSSGTVGKLLVGAAIGAGLAYAASHFGVVSAGHNLFHKAGL